MPLFTFDSNNSVLDASNSLDGALDDVSPLEELWLRFEEDADAGWGAGQDHVPGKEGQQAGDPLHDGAHAKHKLETVEFGSSKEDYANLCSPQFY